MARPRQPIEVIQMKGKKHLTQKEIEERKKQEVKVKAKSDNIKPPSYLKGKQKGEFKKIAKQLIELKIMSNLDVDALARYIIARDCYLQVVQTINEQPELILDKDTAKIKDTYFKECRQASSDLGLDISSRGKLVVPTKQTEEVEESIEDKMFGGLL